MRDDGSFRASGQGYSFVVSPFWMGHSFYSVRQIRMLARACIAPMYVNMLIGLSGSATSILWYASQTYTYVHDIRYLQGKIYIWYICMCVYVYIFMLCAYAIVIIIIIIIIMPWKRDRARSWQFNDFALAQNKTHST